MVKNRKNILFALLAAAVVLTATVPILRVIYPLRYYDIIGSMSEKYDLDKFIVMGIIKAESNYIHDARSHVAYGLMQITENTALDIAERMNIEITESDLDNPMINIEIGCYYLNFLYNYYGDIDVALAAYNGGMGNVNRWLNDDMYSSDGTVLHDIPFPETKKYVRNVNKYAWIYGKLYPG
ncbi:MAG: lytic transglycosylase domain-containing protein [Oscillospiraceae bacterium]|nr:lytic transglycosylase domain-containing protein [Oscillospiraceae bacterium]